MASNATQNISPELQQKYTACKNGYKQLVKAIIALEDEKKEHLCAKQTRTRPDQDARADAQVLPHGELSRSAACSSSATWARPSPPWSTDRPTR